MAKALLLLLTAGLIWQGVLVMVLLRRELGTLRWSRVREALWLQAPRDPRRGRTGGKVWWWLLPFVFLFAAKEFVPGLPVPAARDFATFMDTGGGQDFFSGAWGWFAVFVAMQLFNTVLGEELLFRGFLLPRMRGVFGKRDFLANGVLFAAYHVHVPWVIPSTLVDTFALAYPSRRFQSAWMGIIVHSVQSAFFTIAVLAAVLA
jgi:membrane protease YdiL (CAAX protease family)